jgi:hypothetical protein
VPTITAGRSWKVASVHINAVVDESTVLYFASSDLCDSEPSTEYLLWIPAIPKPKIILGFI